MPVAPDKLERLLKAVDGRVTRIEKDYVAGDALGKAETELTKQVAKLTKRIDDLEGRMADQEKATSRIDDLVKSIILNGTKTASAITDLKDIFDKQDVQDVKMRTELESRMMDKVRKDRIEIQSRVLQEAEKRDQEIEKQIKQAVTSAEKTQQKMAKEMARMTQMAILEDPLFALQKKSTSSRPAGVAYRTTLKTVPNPAAPPVTVVP
jgi:peptidoglycan hydrolase CwlO-like protein